MHVTSKVKSYLMKRGHARYLLPAWENEACSGGTHWLDSLAAQMPGAIFVRNISIEKETRKPVLLLITPGPQYDTSLRHDDRYPAVCLWLAAWAAATLTPYLTSPTFLLDFPIFWYL